MEFDESAEREYARQYARDLANDGQPKPPAYRISFEDAARSWEDPSDSNFPQHPTQASTADGYENIDPELLGRETLSADTAPVEDSATTNVQSSVPDYAQRSMQAYFSMNEVNARLQDNGAKLAAESLGQVTFAHSGEAMSTPFTPNFGAGPDLVAPHDPFSSSSFVPLPFKQSTSASYGPQKSRPSSPIQPSPAKDYLPSNLVRTQPTTPKYMKKSAKKSARRDRSTGMGPGWSATEEIRRPAPNPHYPATSHSGLFVPPRVCAIVAAVPQSTQLGFYPQPYHPSKSVPWPDYPANGTQPLTVSSTHPFSDAMAPPSSPRWHSMQSPNTTSIPATDDNVFAQRRPAWSTSTFQRPPSVAAPSVFTPSNAYVQAPGWGRAPEHSTNLSAQSYQAWPPSTSQYPESMVFRQNFMPGIPYQPAPGTASSSAHTAKHPPHAYPVWSSTPPQIPRPAATHQSSVPASPFISPAAASPSLSLPSDSWDKEGGLGINDIDCCGQTCCEYRCPSDPCPSGCITSCTGSETCGSIYECTGSCRSAGSVPTSRPISRSLSTSTRNTSLGPSPITPARSQVYQPPLISRRVSRPPVLAQSQAPLGALLLPVPAPAPASSPPAKQCLWVNDTSTRQICGARFQTANDLQLHLHYVHGIDNDSVVVCEWDDCRRHREPFQTPQKLRRHTYIHTGCKKFY